MSRVEETAVVVRRLVSRHGARLCASTLTVLFLISVVGRDYRDSPHPRRVPAGSVQPSDYTLCSDGDQVQVVRRARLRDSCVSRQGHGVLTPMNPYFATKFFPASLTLAEEEGIAW